MPSSNFSEEAHVKTLIQKKLSQNAKPKGTGNSDAMRFDELCSFLKKKKVMRRKTESLYLLYKLSNVE